MIRIIDLQQAPETFENDILNNIPISIQNQSQMHTIERKFINGLVREFQPKRILEIGVAEGGGSVVLLNAINDIEDSTVTSIDLHTNCWQDSDKSIGYTVLDMYENGNNQWELYTGVDFSNIANQFNEKFDFCVIDTAHFHPVESINFITALPYLTDNAIVVFHDLTLFAVHSDLHQFPNIPLANKLCFDSIVGDKLKPIDKSYLDACFGMSSIGAVQINNDTLKYIQNTFDMLFFPWASFTYVSTYIHDAAKIIKNNYSEDLYEVFVQAAKTNVMLTINNYQYINKMNFKRVSNNINNILIESEKTYFYGAGVWGRLLLELFQKNKYKLPSMIFDQDANNKSELFNIPVVLPDFERFATDYDNVTIVISISDEEESEKIKSKILTHSPFTKIITLKEALYGIFHVDLDLLCSL